MSLERFARNTGPTNREIVNCHLPFCPPQGSAVHKSKAVTPSHKRGNIALRPFGVDDTLFVDEVVYSFAIEQHYDSTGAKLEGENSSIRLTPFFQPVELASVSRCFHVQAEKAPHFFPRPDLGI